VSEEKPGECDSCGFETEALQEYPRTEGFMGGPPAPYWACDVCASSMISRMVCNYPKDISSRDILRSIGMCTNMILAEIRKAKP